MTDSSMVFFTPERMMEFWGYCRMLLISASPMVMISVALIAVGLTISIIVRIFAKAKEDDGADQDYEVKHY